MECNKEEAIRAKGIAESRMLNKDFIGARKILLKAQQLYPDLENVAQMLSVCEVHCSGEGNINGEKDWYGVLQVMPTADELTIRKQYRKLALLLHPDKNKFGGAEAAFKLVGEAHMTLTNRSKRALHDMKRGASFKTVSARQSVPQPNKASYAKKQAGFATTFSSSTSTQSNGFNQQQSSSFSRDQTFWTICPSCGIKYQYYQNILNKTLRCQSCKKPFIAYDINAHVPAAPPQDRTGIPQQEKRVPGAHFAGPKSNNEGGSEVGSQANVADGTAPAKPCQQSGSNMEFNIASNKEVKEDLEVERDNGTTNDVKFEKVKLQEVNKREQAVKLSARNRSQKRGRKILSESGESESSDSDVIVEDGCHSTKNTDIPGNYRRRSTRQKQNISYNEDQSDEDFVGPNYKKSRVTITTGNTEQNNGNGIYGQNISKNEPGLNAYSCPKPSVSLDFSSETLPDDPEGYTYPDPEFYDFDELRYESKFAVDQVWAVYDNSDAMPRYYALIRQVYSPKFKVRFSWLEYDDPSGRAETLRYKGRLSIGCGSFKVGKSEHTQERLMFSHLMPWRKGARKNTYDIFPRKSEVWALFKKWDIEWGSCVDTRRQYEYEIVEILSDFTEGDVISAVSLVKVQGFVSLFVQATDKGSSPLTVQMKDIFQFSHMIPSYRLQGNERKGILKGSLELDCASLPDNFAEILPSISAESYMARVGDSDNACNGVQSNSATRKDKVPISMADKNNFEANGVSVEELQKSYNFCGNKVNDTCKEPDNSGMAEHSAGGSKHHAQSEYTTCEQMNVAAQDPNTGTALKHHAVSQQTSTNSNWYEYPDSEFHNFEEERLPDKFEEGQIWALYSDMDKNPNYYGLISKIEREKFKVYVTWLEGIREQDHETLWFEEQLPVGCGTFKLMREGCVLDTTDTFSHLVHANPASKKNQFFIYPRTGEVWAIYKKWNLGWYRSELEDCDFDLVEIVDVNSDKFKVLELSKVTGYRAVFKAERRGASTKTMDISFCERLKFSHKIPAFRLTEERGGKLRGYWELDPASVPDLLLIQDST